LTKFINHNVDYQLKKSIKCGASHNYFFVTDNEVSFSPQHSLVAGMRNTDIIIHLLN